MHKTASGLYVPESAAGLAGVAALPGTRNDPVPSEPIEPQSREIIPRKWAKSDCRFCNGTGEIKRMAGTETLMDLCTCVAKRLAMRRGPRR